MPRSARSRLDWIALGLLGALVTANALLLAIHRTGGPAIGIVLYAAVLWRWLRGDYGAALIGGLIGMVVHVVEAVTMGWTRFPPLGALNLLLPAVLVPLAWARGRKAQRERGDSRS